MSRITIITVNFKQIKVTEDFLRSVLQHASNEDIELILVDNGTSEDNEAYFKKIYPDLVYIRSNENLGFAGGNNLGIRAAKGEYILLLNNDTEITENLIPVLLKEMKSRPDIGLISPLILYHENPKVIQYAGFTEMNYLTGRNRGIGNMEIDEGQYYQESRQTGYCHGAAMMCRKEDLEKAGLMSEDFFLYYEELDWCDKFKKIGKKIWFTGKTKIYHKESMSVGKESKVKTYFMTRNRMLYIRRNTNLINTIIFSAYYICFACPKQVLVYIFKNRLELVKWVFKGVFWNLTNSKSSSRLGFKI